MAVRPSVLFLGSAPLDEEPLELTREFEAISEELERSGFAVNSRWHVRASALPKLVDTYAPHVLHFSGHGHDKGLVFEGEHGDGHVADPHAVARVFELLRGRVRCVVLNACSTRAQARLIAKHVDVVIATSKPIYDSTARQFARLFYDHLGRGRSVGESFELAKVGLHLDGDPDHRVLRLVKRPGVSPNEVFLDRAPTLGITSERPATTHRQFEGPPVAHFTGRADERRSARTHKAGAEGVSGMRPPDPQGCRRGRVRSGRRRRATRRLAQAGLRRTRQ